MALNTKRKYSILRIKSQDLNSVLLLKQNNVCDRSVGVGVGKVSDECGRR